MCPGRQKPKFVTMGIALLTSNLVKFTSNLVNNFVVLLSVCQSLLNLKMRVPVSVDKIFKDSTTKIIHYLIRLIRSGRFKYATRLIKLRIKYLLPLLQFNMNDNLSSLVFIPFCRHQWVKMLNANHIYPRNPQVFCVQLYTI